MAEQSPEGRRVDEQGRLLSSKHTSSAVPGFPPMEGHREPRSEVAGNRGALAATWTFHVHRARTGILRWLALFVCFRFLSQGQREVIASPRHVGPCLYPSPCSETVQLSLSMGRRG